jgi:hypothetical protein
MGSQQLLLIVLGVLLVGIAIYVALTMFGSGAENSTRSAMINDLQTYGASARTYYTKLQALGGGKGSFTEMTPGSIGLRDNENARYFIQTADKDLCVIVGMGRIVASNDDSVQVRIRITPQRNQIEILN